MVGALSPLAVTGLALNLLCRVAGVPTLGTVASTVNIAEAQPPAVQAVAIHVAALPNAAPAAPHFIVRGFRQIGLPPVPSVSGAGLIPAVLNRNDSSASPASLPLPARPSVYSYGKNESEGDAAVSLQEFALVAMINRERAARGENALTIDPLLTRVARGHSEDMYRRDYFDHYAPGPGPVTPMDRYLAAASDRPEYAMVGENIFYRSATDSIGEYAAESHDAFMHSPGHRANILTPQYNRVGVGIYRNPSTGEYWVTEMFLTVSSPM